MRAPARAQATTSRSGLCAHCLAARRVHSPATLDTVRHPVDAMSDRVPVASRTYGSAILDALPDALAAAACGIAWAAPRALGFDLLAGAAPLYFIELPLAVIVAFAGVRRLRDPRWSLRARARYVVLPTLLLALLGGALLGPWGLLAILWLGSLTLARLLASTPDTSPEVPGLWLVFRLRSKQGEPRYYMAPDRPAPEPGMAVVPAGHAQLMAAVTIATWFAIPCSFLLFPDFGAGGATPGYAAAVGWTGTAIGQLVPAHVALAAGLVLFALRTLSHFEGIGEPPAARIEDDPLLQEVIEKVEGRRARRHARRKRR
jgi:hypothetical protein